MTHDADEQARMWNGPVGGPGSRTRNCSTGYTRHSRISSSLPYPRNRAARARRGMRGRRHDARRDRATADGATGAAPYAHYAEARALSWASTSQSPASPAARARAERDHAPATFICANAQVYPFEPARFDLIISRFGVMFFDDSGRRVHEPAARPRDDGELRVIAWRERGRRIRS